MNRLGYSITVLVLMIVTPVYGQGSLQLGAVTTVENEHVIVPVILGGQPSEGVAAMDFRITYDPTQYRPVTALPGDAAKQVDKLVQANEVRPGEYIVVMMGMNQMTLTGGEVARVELAPVKSGQGYSSVQLVQPTLSTADGKVMQSAGDSSVVHVGRKENSNSTSETVTSAGSSATKPVAKTTTKAGGNVTGASQTANSAVPQRTLPLESASKESKPVADIVAASADGKAKGTSRQFAGSGVSDETRSKGNIPTRERVGESKDAVSVDSEKESSNTNILAVVAKEKSASTIESSTIFPRDSVGSHIEDDSTAHEQRHVKTFPLVLVGAMGGIVLIILAAIIIRKY